MGQEFIRSKPDKDEKPEKIDRLIQDTEDLKNQGLACILELLEKETDPDKKRLVSFLVEDLRGKASL
jgi:hypothetical protein